MSMPPYGPGPQDARPAQQPYPPQPPYYPYGYGGVEHPQGTLILVLGILGIAVCGILGPIAWGMGNKAIHEIDMNPAAYTNRGVVQAGRICGIVGTAFLVLGLLYVVLLIVIFGSIAATGGG